MSFYGSYDEFLVYCDERGYEVTHSESRVEAALLVASEWLDATYRKFFQGLKVGQRYQIREWPRTGVVDNYGYAVASNEVPWEIEHATFEAALRELASSGSLTVDYVPPKYKSVSIDGAVSVQYASVSSGWELQPEFLKIDQILAPILRQQNFNSPLVGSSVVG